MARFKIIDFFFGKSEPKSEFYQSNYWSGSNMMVFNGEKTPLELGSPIDWQVDYYSMRQRAWEAYLMTDVVQNVIEKYCLWLVGAGLKLQCEPVEGILSKYGYNSEQLKNLTKEIEDNFRLYANSELSDYSNEQDTHLLASTALKNAILSGDCLVILRYIDGKCNIQLIDGCHISTPFDKISDKKVDNGVQVDEKGKHIGYWVRNSELKWDFVPAYNSLGQRISWLMYGRRYKIHNNRGMSLLSAILESVAKMDRYKDATIGAAEENSKIPYTIEHNQFSTGENPMINQVAQSLGKSKGSATETQTINPDILATKVAQTTSKQAYNMPVGSSLKRHDAKVDINFKDFFMVNIDIIYSTLGIPAEVALDKFEGSYSSSRAALKSWEYKIQVDRINILKKQFYKPFYNFWLDIQVINSNILISGYLKAMQSGNFMFIEAIRNARFIGATVPHIDPLKEVMAQRKKLGTSFDNIPLITAEQACEELNTGDFTQIINKATNEKNISSSFDVVEPDGDDTTEIPGKPS